MKNNNKVTLAKLIKLGTCLHVPCYEIMLSTYMHFKILRMESCQLLSTTVQDATRFIQKIRGQYRSPSNYLSEIQNQYIIFCKNIYSVNMWVFSAIGQIDLILINFKTITCFVPTEQTVTSMQYISQVYEITSLYFTQNQTRLTHSLKTMFIPLNYKFSNNCRLSFVSLPNILIFYCVFLLT
jgi:hypothetical protein